MSSYNIECDRSTGTMTTVPGVALKQVMCVCDVGFYGTEQIDVIFFCHSLILAKALFSKLSIVTEY